MEGNSRVVSKGTVIIYPGKISKCRQERRFNSSGYYALATGKGLPTFEEPY